MGTVRLGNPAHELCSTTSTKTRCAVQRPAFFDERPAPVRPTAEQFRALEAVGERAFAVHDQPDAGSLEFRTIARVHTYSSVMCWAACDRLANAAEKLGLAERARHWRDRAATVRSRIEQDAWTEAHGRFAASFDGTELDASLLQMVDLRSWRRTIRASAPPSRRSKPNSAAGPI
jgi:hypothetical protein